MQRLNERIALESSTENRSNRESDFQGDRGLVVKKTERHLRAAKKADEDLNR